MVLTFIDEGRRRTSAVSERRLGFFADGRSVTCQDNCLGEDGLPRFRASGPPGALLETLDTKPSARAERFTG
jgi:hypothetical protein